MRGNGFFEFCQLAEGNPKLKQLEADLSPDKNLLREGIAKSIQAQMEVGTGRIASERGLLDQQRERARAGHNLAILLRQDKGESPSQVVLTLRIK